MKLAEIFSDGMVLQANRPVRIFGSGRGTVEIDFLGKKYSLCSEKEEWEVELEPHRRSRTAVSDIFIQTISKATDACEAQWGGCLPIKRTYLIFQRLHIISRRGLPKKETAISASYRVCRVLR